jgi:hypothetical protein
LADIIGLLDVGLAVGFVGLLILWMDERSQRIDLESRLKRHRTNVLLSNAHDKVELIERGG